MCTTLECYACSYLLGQSDATCLTNASAVRALNCTKKYCLTVRQEAIHNGNKVISFLRDCQDKPVILNGVKTDDSFRFYYRSCQQNLCNGHNGRVSNSSGGGGGGGGGVGALGGNHNAIIPGKNGCLGSRPDSVWLRLLLLLMPAAAATW
ncbi:GH20677 [Drosophila grimshawi]|uniref:GH20677 n=1 Tax=Drosophila grimshawi TaxID=7222 RepID=B4J740_DROGR|nr:GH20677 [Drosophila grimshawi]